MLWRWIARDPSRVYTLVTTSQHGALPDGVRSVVQAAGGEVIDLPAQAPALERAAALRALAADADLIVLFHHPHDPLPTIAFSRLSERPPIVMFNHGDQWFWFGRGIVDVLMNMRSIGATLTERRGFPPARTLATPFPVSGPDGHGRLSLEEVGATERAQARAAVLGRLGWPEDTLLLVTVGSVFKYEGPEGHRLLDLIEPVLAAAPNARLVAAGPEPVGQWAEMSQRTGGRVVALGSLPEGVGVLHAAGDIYLESAPTGGGSAPAEAAASGMPVIGSAATPLEREFFVFDATYGTLCVEGQDEYRALLSRLIADPALRAELGDAARRALTVADEGWEPAVERAFELARTLGPIGNDELSQLPEPDEVDVVIDLSIGPRRVPDETVERITALFELIGRSPAVSRLFWALDPTSMRQLGHYPVAFAAPPALADALRATVAEFRLLRDMRIAERFTIALEPDAAAEAVPLLEAALAEGTDVDIDVIIDPEPSRLRPEGSLEVVVADDGSGDPHRHVCPSPVAVR
jgi:glycosyltransferase involved in cell wall biosynthesis